MSWVRLKVLKLWRGRSYDRIPYQPFFSTRKYFTILFKILDFLRPLDRFEVHIISEFYMAWRKNFTKIFIYRRRGRCRKPPSPLRVNPSLFSTRNLENLEIFWSSQHLVIEWQILAKSYLIPQTWKKQILENLLLFISSPFPDVRIFGISGIFQEQF